MTVVFFCQSCGSRFELDAKFAGKNGACKKCGQRMTIPRAQELASMAAMPAVAAAGAGRTPHSRPADAPEAPFNVALVSQAELMPLTVAGARGLKPPSKATPLDDDSGSALYSIVKTMRKLPQIGAKSKSAGLLRRFYRKELGGVQKLLRWVSDTAYLASTPFLVVILLGIAIKSRPVALLGAAVAVLLNIGRFAAGLLNLIVIHFRASVTEGILFLIPPITVVYLITGWSKMQKAIRRVVEPAVTIGLVILAFMFIPWLRHGTQQTGSLKDQVQAEAGALQEDVRGALDKAKNLDADSLRKTAQGKLHELQGQLQGGGGSGSAAPPGANPAAPESAVEGKLKRVTDQIRQRTNEIQNEP
jgi:hypothetical protein